MKWAILLYGLGISGGANVIFEHALYAYEKGVEITFVSLEYQGQEVVAWHRGTENFNYCTLEEVTGEYDVAIATEWKSAFDCYKIKAKKYIYFVQSIESRFFKNQDSMLAYIANASYELDYNYITEASWIQEYLKYRYHKTSTLVLNGIDKRIFNNEGMRHEKKGNRPRFLVEGSVSNWLKNVPKTIELCKNAGAEDIWLVTPDNVKSYSGVSKVFSRVPIGEMSSIYRSCDILVKLSLVEGMFGPPLEMFHCGGTAIVYDIEGAEEYIKNGYNAIVVEKNNEQGVIDAIKTLLEHQEQIDELKEHASKTAKDWIDWNTSSNYFYNCICNLPDISGRLRENLIFKAKSGAIAYRKIMEMFGAERFDYRIKEASEFIKSNGLKLFIFGAGYYCKSTIVGFYQYDVEVSGIIVSNKSSNPTHVLGHRVMELKELEQYKNVCFIYISVQRGREEIVKDLKDSDYQYFL